MGINVKDDDLKQVVELASALEKAADEVRIKGDTLQKEVKNLGAASAETKAAVDKALIEHNELAKKHAELVARTAEIEQTLAQRRQSNEDTSPKSLGERFVESDQFKGFNGSRGRGSVRVEMSRKDILNVTATVGSGRSTDNALSGSTRVAQIYAPERRLVIRDLLAPGQTNQGNVEYTREVAFTNAARVVTEGDTKPSSNITFNLINAPVRTVAHIFKASRQILDDAPALASYIDARARYGLMLAEEDEILNGDGTGQHLSGIVPAATAYNASFTLVGHTRLDSLRQAILQVALAYFPATGIVLNPIDWAQIQTLKDSQGRYIIGNPQDGNVPRLWGLPVVESISMTATEFLVGAFRPFAQIFDRMEIEVLLSTENSTDFEKNMVTIRAEERLALAIYRTDAFVHGDFDTAT
jgi:HK97 family phage major capsid protein